MRVVLEKIEITDDREPFFKGRGEFRFVAWAWTPDNGGILKETVLPATGHFSLGGRRGGREVTPNAVLFGRYAPDGGAIDALDLDGWKLWFRIEPA